MAVSVNSPSIAYFSGNPIYFECESDQYGVVDNLRMECLIQLHNSVPIYRAVRIYETPNEDGKFIFNLGPAINSMMRDWFDLPDFENSARICGNTTVIAELSFIEIYDGAEQAQANFTTRIVPGGLRIEQLDTANDWWTIMELYTDGGDATQIPFLTNKPKISTWKPGIPESLYYYNAISYGFHTMTINIECFDEYGNSLEVITETFAMNYAHKITMFAIGKLFEARFALGPNDGYYDVWIEDGGNRISEKRTYFIDKKYYQNLRTIAFQNKKGGFDILALTGADVQGGSIEQTIIGKEYVKGQTIDVGVHTVTNKKSTRRVKKSSGFLSKSDRQWLIDLLESKLVYEIINYDPDNLALAKLLPIKIENKDLPIIDSTEFRGDLLIEWSY